MRACHAMSGSHHAFRRCLCRLHPSLFNVVEWEWFGGKNWSGLRLRRSMQKGEEPISEPNWAAKRPFVRSPLRARGRPYVLRGNVARHVSKREWGLG